jgi:hypothetical protein
MNEQELQKLLDKERAKVELLKTALDHCKTVKYFNPVANEWQPSVAINIAYEALNKLEKL